MKSDELFVVLRAALADDWTSDDEVRTSWGHFEEGRVSHTTPEELKGDSDWTSDSAELRRIFDEAMASPAWPVNAAETRIATLWTLLAEKLTQLGAPPHHATVRGLRTKRMEASTLLADDGSLIVVDLALHDLVAFHLQLILASTTLPFDTIGGAPVPPPVMDRSTAARAGRAMLGALRWTGEVGLPLSVVLTDPTAGLQFEVLEDAEQFVLAHEHGHALLGHLGDPAAGNQKAMQFGPVGAMRFAPEWGPELEADVFAAQVMLHGLQPPEMIRPLLAIAVTLNVMELATRHRFVLPPDSHPDANTRLGNIIASLFGRSRHPAVEVALGIVGDYFEQVEDFFDVPNFADDPLEARLSNVAGLFAPRGDLADVSAWEFWGSIMTTHPEISMLMWARDCVRELDLHSSPHLPRLPRESDPMGAGGVTAVAIHMAIGREWFDQTVIAKLPEQTLASLQNEGTTFRDVRVALQVVYGSDTKRVSEAMPLLELWCLEKAGRAVPLSDELRESARRFLHSAKP